MRFKKGDVIIRDAQNLHRTVSGFRMLGVVIGAPVGASVVRNIRVHLRDTFEFGGGTIIIRADNVEKATYEI